MNDYGEGMTMQKNKNLFIIILAISVLVIAGMSYKLESSDLVVIGDLDKELIHQKIEQGKEFLFRAMHENEHGFYKKYDAWEDDFGKCATGSEATTIIASASPRLRMSFVEVSPGLYRG